VLFYDCVVTVAWFGVILHVLVVITQCIVDHWIMFGTLMVMQFNLSVICVFIHQPV